MSSTTRLGSSPLVRLLADRAVLVADGGMGTTLLDLGLDPNAAPEIWNVEHPASIAQIHADYVAAGADIILTNSFGGNRLRLAHRGLADRTEELNAAAATIAREVADAARRPVLVGGSIGPTGSLFAPLGDLDVTRAEEVFSEQAKALVAAGVDVLWIETMSSLEELAAAHEAALRHGLPVAATMSFDTKGHTMMGVAPGALAGWSHQRAEPPAALGANCGIGPAETIEAVRGIAEVLPEALIVAKGNCGIPILAGTDVRYPVGPTEMESYTRGAIEAGARIVGACCGSTPDHIRVIQAEVARITSA
jgi:5-methyltetrahydrofolate--homocysteine methyltransferase